LLSDKRLNIQQLSYTLSLVDALEPLISRRLVNAYLAYPKPLGCGTRSFYALFLRTIIIKRLSPSAALDWLVERTEEVQGKFQEAFRGYFLCINNHLSVDEMSKTLKEEGRSREGIKLAERLVAAHIECEPVSTEMYRRAFKAILGSYD
jgi:hypothetical protein